MEEDFEKGAKNEEMNVGFCPADPDLVFSQIQKVSLESRTLGFQSLISILNEGDPQKVEQLHQRGIFPIILDCLNDTNLQIIGMIATSISLLFSSLREFFDDMVKSLPLGFLMTVSDSSEVIDLIKECVDNSSEFAQTIIKEGSLFSTSLGAWLRGPEPIVKAALDLLNSLSMFSPDCLDFSIVRPFTDQSFSPDLRALAFNILYQVEPSAECLKAIISIVFDETSCETAAEILHDRYLTDRSSLEDVAQQLQMRLLEIISLPSAAILLADLSANFDDSFTSKVVETISAINEINAEQLYVLYCIAQKSSAAINHDLLLKLLKLYSSTESHDILKSAEELLSLYSGSLIDEEAQKELINSVKRGPNDVECATFIVDAFPPETISPNLAQAIAELAQEEDKAELSEKIQSIMASQK